MTRAEMRFLNTSNSGMKDIAAVLSGVHTDGQRTAAAKMAKMQYLLVPFCA